MLALIPSITSALALAVLLALIYAYRRISSNRELASTAAYYGCEECPKYPRNLESELLKARTEASNNGTLMDLYMAQFALYGKIWEENLCGSRIINTMDLRNVQHVISAMTFVDWGKESTAYAEPFFGRGIFSLNGVEWRHALKVVVPAFSKTEGSLDVDSMVRHVDRFISMIPRDGSTTDIELPLRKLFLDSLTEFLLGESIDSQIEGDPNHSADILHALDDTLAGVEKRRQMTRFQRFLHNYDKIWKDACRTVHSYIDIHVQRALREMPTTPEKAGHQSSARYLLLHSMAQHTPDPISLRFQVLQVFIPARDTTAIMLSKAIFHLARTPDIWTQLRAESMALGDRRLTGEDVDKFNPLRWYEYDTEKQAQWQFVPFLGGPRICPAKQQVLTQAVYLLVRMTREFKRIENGDPVEVLKESRNGVKVAFAAA
ncbi:Cytochrome P450 family protein [Rutstroemia sp. NJR-2017a BBW]|nr:Cytochrome P450 family protein [Rutstroemia sp. NJR-2017a BBW]